jgi:tetratricopeptide (TPR) repeat protein
MTADTSPPPDRLSAALQEFQSAIDLGLPVDPADLVARYPDVPDLAADLAALVALNRTGVPSPPEPPPPEPVLADFELLREIGRGGMGVVFEARQKSLGRPVAVKVLTRAAALDERARRRFLHEARAAALVAHPHVVPVFNVGEEQGVPYYVMPLVPGRSLADFLKAAGTDPAGTNGPLPVPGTASYFAAVARVGSDAARALGAAHEQGVIHRDVKPANLLLDDSGKVWVTDFGLALAIGSDGLTRSGDRPGTLRYMSPEQLTGPRDRLDGRADVYSLGATLYELATGRPMFEGDDEELLARLVSDRTPPPPRSVCPTIPHDLETIILKATATDPAERYQTASTLADDLARFAAGEPILARRSGLFRRLGRWTGRNRRAVIAAAAVVFVGGALVQLLTWKAYRAETAARSDAERNRQLALAALVNLGNASDEILAHTPGMQDRQLAFLVKCRDEVEPFARDESLPVRVRRDIAWVHYRLAEVRYRTGRYADAEDSARTLAARIESLVAIEPENPGLRTDLAHAHRLLAVSHKAQGRPAESRANVAAAIVHAEKVLALRSDSPPAIVLYHELRCQLADVDELSSGRPGAAIPTYLDAIRAFEALRDRFPTGHPLSYIRLASYWGTIAGKYEASGDWEAADRAYVKAIENDDRLITHFADQPPNIREYSWHIRGRRGLLLIGRGKIAEGLPLLRVSVRDVEAAVSLYPHLSNPKRCLLEDLSSLALVEHCQGLDAEARITATRCAERLAAFDTQLNPNLAARVWAFLPAAVRTPSLGEKLIAEHAAALPPWLRGAVLSRQGRFADALSVVESDSSLHSQFLRVLCLAKLDRLTDARTVFEATSPRYSDAPIRDPELVSLNRDAAALLERSRPRK